MDAELEQKIMKVVEHLREQKLVKVIDQWTGEVYGTFLSREEAEDFVATQLNNIGVYYS